MKNKISLIALSTLFLASPVFAKDLYVSVGMESVARDLTLDNVNLSAYNLAVGKEFSKGRVETEVVIFDDVNTVSGNGLYVNGYYTPVTMGSFTPFVGAGLGYSSLNKVKNTNGLTSNMQVGVSYNLNDTWAVDIGGKYLYSFNQKVSTENFEDATVFTKLRAKF